MDAVEIIHNVRSVLGYMLAGIFVFVLTKFRERIINFIWRLAGAKKVDPTLPQQHPEYTRVNQTLTELRVMLRADRCYVWQFHNGNYFHPNTSIWHITTSYEICGRGRSYQSTTFKSILYSQVWEALRPWYHGLSEQETHYAQEPNIPQELISTLGGMRLPRVIVIEVSKLPLCFYRAKLEEAGTEFVAMAPIMDSKSQDPHSVVGLLLLDWCSSDEYAEVEPHLEFGQIALFAQMIGLSLSTTKPLTVKA